MSLIANNMLYSMDNVDGYLTIIPNQNMIYAGKLALYFNENFGTNIIESEPLVEVMVTDKKGDYDSHSWSQGEHHEFGEHSFPSNLPLSLIDKKGGDIVKLIAWGKKINLTCQNYTQSFEDELKKLKEKFNKFPSFYFLDENDLIEKKIIEVVDRQNFQYKHGQHGYKFQKIKK